MRFFVFCGSGEESDGGVEASRLRFLLVVLPEGGASPLVAGIVAAVWRAGLVFLPAPWASIGFRSGRAKAAV